jgi:hypothetical protein
MKKLLFVIMLLSGSFLLAQDSTPASANQGSKDSNGQVTVQGCVSRASGDYTLIKQNPAITYELQGTRKVKLSHYLGQRVEVTGTEGPSMSTSSDAMNKTGNAAPITISVSSIKAIDKDCPVR